MTRDEATAPTSPAPADAGSVEQTEWWKSRPVLAIAVVVAGAVVIFLRRPDAFTNPQFWAEDGAVWFADQYNNGVVALLHPSAGYLQTLPRLVAVVAVHLDLTSAALLFNLVGLAVQLAPAAFATSRRLDRVAPLRARLLMAAAYLLLPSFEIHVNITNAQWHLAILAILVIVADPPRNAWWRAFDLGTIVLSALTGPFVVLLLPAILVRLYREPSARRWYGVAAACAGIAAGCQAWAYLHAARQVFANLGANIHDFLRIVVWRLSVPAVFGAATPPYYKGFFVSSAGLVIIVIATVLVIAGALAKQRHQVVLTVVFLLAVTASGLASPVASPHPSVIPQWRDMVISSDGSRYFFTGELALLACIGLLAARIRRRAARDVVLAGIAALFMVGAYIQPQYPAYRDLHPATYNAILQAAPAGSTVRVPINPPGDTMTLVRAR